MRGTYKGRKGGRCGNGPRSRNPSAVYGGLRGCRLAAAGWGKRMIRVSDVVQGATTAEHREGHVARAEPARAGAYAPESGRWN